MEQLKLIICPQCGAENKPSLEACRMCANPLQGTEPINKAGAKSSDLLSTITFSIHQAGPTICSRCGTSNEPIYIFCHHCGGKLHQEPAEKSPAIDESQSSEKAAVSDSPDKVTSIDHMETLKSDTQRAYCPKCSQPVSQDSIFCNKCGAPILASQTAKLTSVKAMPKPRLVLIVEGEQTGDEYELKVETVIGRTSGDLTFPHDDYMSGLHARVVKRDNKYTLKDESSRNGTFLRIKEEIDIEPGDMILIGKQIFRFEI